MENIPPQLTEILNHIQQRFPGATLPDYAVSIGEPFTVADASGKIVAKVIPPREGDNPSWRWKDVSNLPPQ
jgi:hypothetical protein